MIYNGLYMKRCFSNGLYTVLSGLSDSDNLYRYKNKKGVAVQPTN